MPFSPDSWAKAVSFPSGAKGFEYHSIEGGAVLFHVQIRDEVEERKAVKYMFVTLCDVRKRIRNGREHVIVPKFKLESEEIFYDTVEIRGELISDGRPACKQMLRHP